MSYLIFIIAVGLFALLGAGGPLHGDRWFHALSRRVDAVELANSSGDLISDRDRNDTEAEGEASQADPASRLFVRLRVNRMQPSRDAMQKGDGEDVAQRDRVRVDDVRFEAAQ